MVDELDDERIALHEKVGKMSEAARGSCLISASKAAFYLGVSASDLANRRKRNEPPPPSVNFSGGTQGKDVRYSLLTIFQFSMGQPISQKVEPASAVAQAQAAFYNNLASTNSQIAKGRVNRHRMAWATTVDPAVAEDAEFPFFVNDQGLVLGPAWQSVQQTFDWFMAPDTDVTFQTWVRGLAMVWVNESERLAAINDCAQDAPEVPELVTQFRKQQLAAI